MPDLPLSHRSKCLSLCSSAEYLLERIVFASDYSANDDDMGNLSPSHTMSSLETVQTKSTPSRNGQQKFIKCHRSIVEKI